MIVYELKTGGRIKLISDQECDTGLIVPPIFSILDERSIAVRCANGLHILSTKEWRTELVVRPVDVPGDEFGTMVYGRNITAAALNRQADILAYVVKGQTEDYTGESNNTALIQIVRFSTGEPLAYIFSGLVESIQLAPKGDNVIVAKRGGRIERWALFSLSDMQHAASLSIKSNEILDEKEHHNDIVRNRLTSYYVLIDDEPGEKHDDLSPGMYRTGHTRQKPMDVALYVHDNVERYAVINGGMLTVFDAVPDPTPYLDMGNPQVSLRVISSAPVSAESDDARAKIMWFDQEKIIVKVTLEGLDTDNEHVKHLIVKLSMNNNVRLGLEEEVRSTSQGFLYIGVDDWGMSCDGNSVFIKYQEADTRYSTRSVTVNGAVRSKGFSVIQPLGAHAHSSIDWSKLGCVILASDAKQDDWANKLVVPVGGRRAVSNETRETVMFLQGNDHLAIWSGLGVLNKPIREVVDDLESRTRLRLQGGMIAELK